MFKKITPVLVVEQIEPCLPFWTERLGFQVTVQVPHEEQIGFVILQREQVELMYQTRKSVEADMGTAVPVGTPSTVLYLEVKNLDDVALGLGDYPISLARRRTFYGTYEFGVVEPGGTTVVFSEHIKE